MYNGINGHAMSQEVSKEELLRRLATERACLNTLLAQLTAEQLVVPGVLGVWSVKDVLAHLIAHEQRALRELHSALRGERMEIDHNANDDFNAHAVLANQTRTAAEVRDAWTQSYQQIIAAVESLSDTDFAVTSPLVEILDDTVDGVFGNNTYEHYAEHRAHIESWLRTYEHREKAAETGAPDAGDI